MILNLVNHFNSEVKYQRIVFPDGQDHIKIEPIYSESVKIVTSLKNASDLFVLLQATEVLRSWVDKIYLEITYLLSARMDRRMNPGEPITLKIVAQLINQQNYNSVEIFDPHSDVSLTLIDKSFSSPKHATFISGAISRVEKPTLISPDAGASKKLDKVAYTFSLPIVHCTKSRSTVNGYLSNFKVETDDLKQANCLILDDICDGGGTFIGLAKELKAKNAGKLYLAVSHGIFSKGLEVLSDFEEVVTTNSYKHTLHEKLVTYNLW